MIDPKEAKCLSVALYREARGEGGFGLQRVADVILNRRDRKWRGAETVCEIVTPDQFEGMERASDPIEEPDAMRMAMRMAVAALSPGYRRVTGADHFHTIDIAPWWSRDPKLTKLETFGRHVFYRHR